MKASLLTKAAAALILSSSTIYAGAQDKGTPADNAPQVYFHSQLKSMHLWRGIAVTNAAVIDGDAGIDIKNGLINVGVWGGYGINGVYKEFDYYAKITPVKGLTFAVWDIYNYSSNATWNNTNMFDYKPKTSGRFIDVSVSYTLQGTFPLNLYWATVVQGRDRGVNNDHQLYSNYIQATAPIIRHQLVDVDLYVGGNFAFNPEDGSDATFYGRKPGLNNVGVIFSKTLVLGKYKIPVTAAPSWSIVNKWGNIQLAANIF